MVSPPRPRQIKMCLTGHIRLYVLIAICMVRLSAVQGGEVPKVFIGNLPERVSTRHFTPATMTIVEDGDSSEYAVLLRRRGASSRMFAKPSYSVKILDARGALLGMRPDDDWILDGMVSDPTRMRNRIAMDVWNEIAPAPWYHEEEPAARYGYEGRIVEMDDGRHRGIYCLSERIDRKQLRLRRTDRTDSVVHGVLFKTSEWKYSTFLTAQGDMPRDTASRWGGWEMVYPKETCLRADAWHALRRFYAIAAESDSALFADSIACYLDIPAFMHYTLLVMLAGAYDNAGKNCYWAFYNIAAGDLKAVVVPWDMDLCFGRQFMAQPMPPDIMPMDRNMLHRRMMRYYPHYSDSLRQCYSRLRQRVFSIGHLDSIAAAYISLYQRTGLDSVEQQQWDDRRMPVCISSEQTYIHAWLEKRLRFLDEQLLLSEDSAVSRTDTAGKGSWHPQDRSSRSRRGTSDRP